MDLLRYEFDTPFSEQSSYFGGELYKLLQEFEFLTKFEAKDLELQIFYYSDIENIKPLHFGKNFELNLKNEQVECSLKKIFLVTNFLEPTKIDKSTPQLKDICLKLISDVLTNAKAIDEFYPNDYCSHLKDYKENIVDEISPQLKIMMKLKQL